MEDFLFNDSRIFIYLSNRNSHYKTKIEETYKVTVDILNRISNTFPNYTLHDIKHSCHVLKHMYDLLGPYIEKYSDIELSAMIYAALLHDIGMYVNDEEKQKIIKGEKDTEKLKFKAVKNTLNGNENEAIQQFVRPIHSERSKEYIEKNLKALITIPETSDISYANHIGDICLSHERDVNWIKNNLDSEAKIGNEQCNIQFISMLLRLADLLDFDSLRAPKTLYDKIKLGDYSKEEWQKHFVLSNIKKAYYENNKLNVIFEGNCDDPNTYRKLLEYIKSVESELRDSFELIDTFAKPQYKLPLQTMINNKVKSMGFTTSDLSISVDYKSITKLLMGKNLYGDSKAALREIIQNSIDACNVMKEEYDDDLNRYNPVIHLEISNDNMMIIKDNGTGMTKEIMRKYFLSVGNSYYNSDDYRFKGLKYNPISKYGIGFLSAFMLSNAILIKSKHCSEDHGIAIELIKDSEFVVWKNSDLKITHGTYIYLDYTKFSNSFKTIEEIVDYIKNTFSLANITFIIKNKLDAKIEIKPTKTFDHTIITPSYSIYFNNNFQRHQNSLVYPFDDRNLYFYDSTNCKTEKLNKPINYQNCIDGTVAIMSLEIIDDDTAERINNFYDVCDDEDEAKERYEDDFDNALILLNAEQLEKYKNKKDKAGYRTGRFKNKDLIFDGYSFKEFCNQFEHAYDSTSYNISLYNVIISKDKNLILYKYKPNRIRMNIYCRGVYVNSYNVDLREGIYLKVPNEITIDIADNNIYPNISRDQVSKEVLENISSAVEEELLKWSIPYLEENVKIILESYVIQSV